MGKKASARVFISCGQRDGGEERSVAEKTAGRLKELGFDPYIAVQEHSLRGVKENIFEQLSSSEYFVFIDFQRERLGGGRSAEHRGSLFSHQELAIASYLEIPVLAFQEEGVRRLDGLLGFLQGNCVPFSDRDHLPAIIEDAVRKGNWDSNWRNALQIELPEAVYVDAHDMRARMDGRWFLLRVRNLNRHKAARNCYVYLEDVESCVGPTEPPPRLIEFKWSGYTFPNVTIAASGARDFDAFHVFHEHPTRPQFSHFSDTNFYTPRDSGPGEFQFSYAVYCDNFDTVRAVLNVKLSENLDELSVKLVE